MWPPRIPYLWFFFGVKVLPERVICFVDGFNLYHALHSIGKPHLKWLDLRKLKVDPKVKTKISSRYVNFLPSLQG
jgi:hypothetical protein